MTKKPQGMPVDCASSETSASHWSVTGSPGSPPPLQFIHGPVSISNILNCPMRLHDVAPLELLSNSGLGYKRVLVPDQVRLSDGTIITFSTLDTKSPF